MRNFACTEFEHHKKKSKEKNSTIKIRKGKSTKVELIKSLPVLEESVPWERSKSAPQMDGLRAPGSCLDRLLRTLFVAGAVFGDFAL